MIRLILVIMINMLWLLLIIPIQQTRGCNASCTTRSSLAALKAGMYPPWGRAVAPALRAQYKIAKILPSVCICQAPLVQARGTREAHEPCSYYVTNRLNHVLGNGSVKPCYYYLTNLLNHATTT